MDTLPEDSSHSDGSAKLNHLCQTWDVDIRQLNLTNELFRTSDYD